MGELTEPDSDLAKGYLVRLNGRAWGMSLGALLAVGLFLATNILLIRGGDNVGAHLQLLSVYFPGYDVSFLCSLIGAFALAAF